MMTVSSRAAFAASYPISGSGLAIAKRMGVSAIDRTISWSTMPPTARPTNTVGTVHRVGQRPALARVCEGFDVLVEALLGDAGLGDDPSLVGHGDVLGVDAEGDVEAGRGQRRGARASKDDLDVRELFVGDVHRVQQRGAGDDRGAVLVVVEYRDVHLLAQPALDLETLRGGDVLDVDPPKVGSIGRTVSTISSTPSTSSSTSKTSMSAKRLNSTLPCLHDGRAWLAAGPMSPRPSVAEPSETTATGFPRAV